MRTLLLVNRLVLDASAVLAVALNERGTEAVLAERQGAMISAVNHAEVVSKLLRHGLSDDDIDQFLIEAFPQVIPFDRRQADIAGSIHALTRRQKLSFADCACLSLSAVHALPVLTGDRKWLDLPTQVLEVEIRLFR